MTVISTLLAGLLFGFGLVVSGLINPAKVLNFLDFAGTWDPSLAFTMGAAVLVTWTGYRLVLAKRKPAFSDVFYLPDTKHIDARLITGSAIFGIGWGLIGFCPGPAIASLSTGSQSAIVFVLAMLAGMLIARGWAAQKTGSDPRKGV